ncbi:MAG: hypothetical protein O6952_09230, partial [Planctomycetota bacterium]|nr:hypothetical protein [Planctomycetota bacterium]
LYPLTNSMIATDEDFTDVAQEILGKGSTLHEEAQVGKEIQALQLEVVGIVIADGLDELDEFGKDTGKRKRSTIILNKTEEYKGTEETVPLTWAPKQRKYFIGSTIIQIADLKIQEIERTKVICLYKDRYEIDLDLKKRGEPDEE